MTGYRLTRAARGDLSSIWDYTEERWGVSQAETYIGELRSAIERIGDDPRRGRTREEVRSGYMSYGVVSHVLFYRENEHGGVDVIRILHQRMDPARHI